MNLLTPQPIFDVVKKSAISEEIVQNLLTLIRQRKLRPGDKLPPERELAATMQVSRPSLREALRALSIMNVVEIRQGDGAYVSSLEPELLMAHLDFVFALTDTTFLSLFEARKILEPGIAALAAQRISDAEISRLEQCVTRSQQLSPDQPDFAQLFVEMDVELHETIARAAQNSILERFMNAVSQLGKASRQRTVALSGVPQRTIYSHLAIIHALKAHNPQAAQQAMLDHLQHVERELRLLTPEEP